ncbi:glucokinase [Thermoflavifilum thermophilum]|uniref:Glucokinase n=1 Tax=Thermoflavifilum thermophilum TaxID=1393122 RepID=A0A1I7NLX6_9BACT|nr:glucokinase [Thermoflavifilum thermophilum]SFV35629.1 glucokinase [Thermoflavifilum thermophilum]
MADNHSNIQPWIPLYLPGLNYHSSVSGANQICCILAADVGGTKTNLALFEIQGNSQPISLVEASYHSRDYDSFSLIVKDFLETRTNWKPVRLCAGVAGPVIDGRVEVTNLPWKMDQRLVSKVVGIEDVIFINDLQATAYGLAALNATQVHVIRNADEMIAGNIAVIAPGTGLGEAGLYYDGKYYHPFATEGGHCDFAPRTELDIALLQYLQKKVEVVSWEHVVSGMGILHIYQFLRDTHRYEEPAALQSQLEQAADKAALISEAATRNEFTICRETMRLFVRYLAHEAANLVLKLKATGGLYLAGGIPPKIIDLLIEERFYTHYLHCDRMQELVEKVPIYVVLNDKTALLGAAYYAAFGPRAASQKPE